MDITSYLLGKKAGGGGGSSLVYVIVDTLPSTGENNVIYLVPKTTSKTNNYYDEYMYISNAWELIGDTEVDLSNYQPLIDSSHKLSSDLVDDTGATNKFFSGNYADLSNKPTIPDELADLSDDSTHRLVTDTEKTTWNSKSDFSGSYNDLTNKPTIPDDSELLHYKGHVNSESDLPDLGQPSYPTPSQYEFDCNVSYIEASFKLSQYNYDDIYNQSVVQDAKTNNTYYIGINAKSSTYIGIGYNDANAIRIKLTDLVYFQGAYYIRGGISIDASVSNPVTLNVYKKYAGDYIYYYDDPTSNTGKTFSSSTTMTLTSPVVLRFDNSFKMITNSTIKYTNNLTDVLGHTDDWINSTVRYGETLNVNLGNSQTYRYANNYKFMNSSQVDTLTLVFDTTTTKLNDTYTVGSNYDIYRRNESTQWDKFSKAPNVVTTISSLSTNSDVPSALAVYNYVNSLNGNGVSY